MISRIKITIFTIIFCYIVIIGRFFYWQIIQGPSLYRQAISQTLKPTKIIPVRGHILDSDNRPLVISQTIYRMSLYKPELKIDLLQLINQINLSHLDLSPADKKLLENFSNNSQQKWITLNHNFPHSELKDYQDNGISFTPQSQRLYPEKDLAKSVLGYSTTGLEAYYQKQLQGKTGFSWESKDATGKTIVNKQSWHDDAKNGLDLHTSLNRGIQSLVENTLKEGLNTYQADSGAITIIQPQTGSVIAMIGLTNEATPSAVKNSVITDLFEPGSIFKPLVVSMALDNQSIDTNFVCTKCGSPHTIGQYTITNWDNQLHPNSTLQDIIKNSDNIGMSYIIQRLGLEKFLDYFNRLGLGQKTNIDLQGESKPVVKTDWPEIDLATASFGQGLAVTQIQMLTAFNTIANDGVLVSPHLVNYFTDENNQIITRPNHTQPVFSATTIQDVKSILKYAVENSVVTKFKSADLEVCAKSGTAQVAVKGGYTDSNTIASYIGFSPCHNPKFTMIVTINNPRSSPWGSSTAAPIWFEIADKINNLL